MKNNNISYSIHSLGEGGWSKSNTFIYLIPYLLAVIFLLLPMLIIIKISISEYQFDIPPYKPLLVWGNSWWPEFNITFSKFYEVLSESIYLKAYFFSLKVAFITTFFTLIIGYPISYAIANLSPKRQYIVLTLIFIPFWTSFLVRVYAWIAILKDKGVLNNVLISLGIISEPLKILYTEFAVYIGMVYAYLPFMIIPIYSSLSQIDKKIIEASRNLGCTRYQSFWKVIFPMSLNGVITGCLLVFIPAIGDFIIPDILGGSESIMLGNTVWFMFFSQMDWPGAMVIVIIMLISLMLPIGIYLFAKKNYFDESLVLEKKKC